VKNITFTLCSNNYLAQANVLGNSLKMHYPENDYLIILVDQKDSRIDYNSIPFEVLPVHELEPNLELLVQKYTIIELNTCVKPRVFEYLFKERKASKVVYFDPDIKVYGRMEELEKAMDENNIVLTPHIFTPIPIDGKYPRENNFLNYGIYNLGFISISNTEESLRFTSWWKERTYKLGFSKVEEGIFVDQLYINLVPILFEGVFILKHKGYNMAPWNLHERYLIQKNDTFFVNDKEELKFFHFSSFQLHSNELPLHYYNRFQLKDRPDLQLLCKEYNRELDEARHSFFSSIPCTYVVEHEQYVKQVSKNQWRQKSLLKKISIIAIRILPRKWKNRLSLSLQHN
jgi:hypothetical protein